jgi:Histone chaperone domain CHZ
MEEIDTANIISDTNPRGTRGKQIDWAKAAEKSREEGDNLDDDDDDDDDDFEEPDEADKMEE